MKIKPDQNAVTMIQELSDAKAPSGFEDEAVAVAKKYGAEFADVEEDCLRNLYLRSKNNTGNKPVFMLDAHSDEVGLMFKGRIATWEPKHEFFKSNHFYTTTMNRIARGVSKDIVLAEDVDIYAKTRDC